MQSHPMPDPPQTPTGTLEPAATIDPGAALQPAPQPAEAPRSLARILVVEDDDEMRAYLGEELSDVGYEVIGASNAIEGLMAMQSDPPDVIVVDWKMPLLDGFEFLGSVTRCAPDIPVIFVTAYACQETSQAAMAKGAFAFIPKPFPFSHLIDAIDGALHRDGAAGATPAQPKRTAEVPVPTPEAIWCEDCGVYEEVGRSSHCRMEMDRG